MDQCKEKSSAAGMFIVIYLFIWFLFLLAVVLTSMNIAIMQVIKKFDLIK